MLSHCESPQPGSKHYKLPETVYAQTEKKQCIHSIGEPVEVHQPLKAHIEVDGNSFYMCTDCYENNPEVAQHVVEFLQ
jgi:hypothetical protein